MKYGRTIEIRMPYAQAVPKVKQTFKDHGFGTLTEIERDLGLLLPCNVVVRESGGKTLVQALDPDVMVKVPERPELEPIAEQAGKGISSERRTQDLRQIDGHCPPR